MHPRAGQHAVESDLIDVNGHLRAYAEMVPDPGVSSQRVSFGTSGHRGRAIDGSFTVHHIRAITQAIVDYRADVGINGPVYVGADTHLLSAPALRTCLEVLAGNQVRPLVDSENRPVPTPALSHAIIAHNRQSNPSHQADGIIITPSHNPPADGGIKYNPPHGGPANETVTAWIAKRANDLLGDTATIPLGPVRAEPFDYVSSYVADLDRVIDMEALKALPSPVGVHPLGGASVHYWQAIADTWSIPLDVVDATIDPRFGFMTLDHDGAIRMDPSSPHVMAVTDTFSERFPLLVANDADADRHGIRTRARLMSPNAFLAVAIDYLLAHRPHWAPSAGIGKTMVSSSMIDRVVADHHRALVEVPVGFKWFVDGLAEGTLAFGGEESAGACFLARDGSTWVTEKDGIVMGLLAMEILAATGRDPAEHYRRLEDQHGRVFTRRADFPATPEATAALAALQSDSLLGASLGGAEVASALTEAPAGGRLGGVKLVTDGGWIAARPSGTEPIVKIYAESFSTPDHLESLLADAKKVLGIGEVS
jgi:phosphoglucomutase